MFEPHFLFTKEKVMASGTHQNAKDAMSSAADRTKDTTSHMADKAKDTASGAVDRARDMASQVADKARDVAGQAADKARDAASTAGRRADQVADKVGSGMSSAADSVRQHAPDSGVLHSAASRVADTLDSGGRYLQEEGLSGLAGDLTEMIKRNPIPALFVGVCVGVLLARALRS